MTKPISKKVMKLLRPLLAEVWEQGYHEGWMDNATEWGRQVRFGTARNPYKEES